MCVVKMFKFGAILFSRSAVPYSLF